MQEKLLQYIWQYSLYNPANLRSADGESITIIHPGRLNTNAGPDFLDARVRIGETLLAGNIELHINASDWNRHNHSSDAAYDNVVLHVIYNDDGFKIPHIPSLELAQHILPHVNSKYSDLRIATSAIPCATQHAIVKDVSKHSWLNRLLAERWEEKLIHWKGILDETAGDWRTLLYWRLAINFGFKINADAFLALAKSLPINILAKHKDNIQQLEALLFGQAGMLDRDFYDEYPLALQKEYSYLSKKYKLDPIRVHSWKFMRLRPANFPTIRIAQFAALIQKSVHLFSHIVETQNLKELIEMFDVTASEYWNNHYVFDEAHAKPREKNLGKESQYNIIINTIAPIQFLYASKMKTNNEQELALTLLDAVPSESNHIISKWKDISWKPGNASQSQALLQLYNNYCTHKRCLDCAIGHQIIKLGPQE
jgi:hypothetical protein